MTDPFMKEVQKLVAKKKKQHEDNIKAEHKKIEYLSRPAKGRRGRNTAIKAIFG